MSSRHRGFSKRCSNTRCQSKRVSTPPMFSNQHESFTQGFSCPKKQQKGFSYIELLVALTLGLVIAAACLQVFYSSASSARQQSAYADLQDNLIFAMGFVEGQIRKANAHELTNDSQNNNNDPSVLSYNTPQGGIVLTADETVFGTVNTGANGQNLTNLHGISLANGKVADALLSRSAIGQSDVAGVKSDQITIQYYMPMAGQYDCQGREIPQGDYVIERYFVRADNNSADKTKSLACASSNYKLSDNGNEPSNGLSNERADISVYSKPNGKQVASYFAGNGSVIVPNVAYLRVLYGVREGSGIHYLPATDTPQIDFAKKQIVGVKLGLLLHSQTSVAKQASNEGQTFSVLDKQNLAVKNNGKHYLWQAVESSIMLRNARAEIKSDN